MIATLERHANGEAKVIGKFLLVVVHFPHKSRIDAWIPGKLGEYSDKSERG